MVTAIQVMGSYSVDDIGSAESFYSDTLELQVETMGPRGPLWVRGPDGHVTMLYARPDHEPATFTVLNLVVESIDDAVDDLASRGVQFLRYDDIEADPRGIARGAGRAVAWFTDPAGNCLSVAQLEV